MSDCQGIFGWLFGHEYRARYSSKEAIPKGLSIERFWGDVIETLKDKEKMYEGDVCKRCGKVVNRK